MLLSATERQARILEIVREEGFADMSSAQVHGVRGISFPIRTFHGGAVAALAVPYLQRLDSQTRIEDSREVLRDIARRISLAIGGGSES